MPPYGSSETRSDEDWLREYSSLLNDSVRLEMRSDVPVGLCLSGGLDSTSLTKIAADHTANVIDTFTAYLPHPQYDERDAVRAFTSTMDDRVRSHLVAPDMDRSFDTHTRVIYHHDEPHAGLIAAAQWEVMKLARQTGITVLLDGQGADESLGGYNFFVESLAADHLRSGQLGVALRLLSTFEDRRGSGLAVGLQRMARSGLRALQSRESLYRLEARLSARKLPLSRDWLKSNNEIAVPTIKRGCSRLESEIATALQVTMLPTLLTFEDRISMAFSIESRVPYLDHRLVELAFRLPRHLRVDGTRTKVILRRLMEGVLPDEIVHARLKKVLGTPFQLWFQGPLIARARDLLDSETFRSRPFVDSRRVDTWFRSWDTAANDRRAAYQVWNMVNLELWFRTFIDQDTVAPLV